MTPLACLVDPVVASLPFLNVWCSPHSQTCLCNMGCLSLWNISIQEDSVHNCDPPDVEMATAFPSEEDDAIREWKQEFPEQTRRAISRIHTNLGHSKNSTLAMMISDTGGSEEMIKCATRYPCSVCKRMSRPRLRRPVCQFQGPDSSMILCWLMCIAGLTGAARGAGVLAN